jgi:hypothetical protein
VLKAATTTTTSSDLTERVEDAHVRLALDLALRKGVPEAEGLVASASNDCLTVRGGGEVEDLWRRRVNTSREVMKERGVRGRYDP